VSTVPRQSGWPEQVRPRQLWVLRVSRHLSPRPVLTGRGREQSERVRGSLLSHMLAPHRSLRCAQSPTSPRRRGEVKEASPQLPIQFSNSHFQTATQIHSRASREVIPESLPLKDEGHGAPRGAVCIVSLPASLATRWTPEAHRLAALQSGDFGRGERASGWDGRTLSGQLSLPSSASRAAANGRAT
jgi:hypothetical protein